MRIMIGTPIFDGAVPIEYFNCYNNSIPVMLDAGIDWQVYPETRNLISISRNRIAHAALEKGFDKVLFIDADMVWDPQWIVKLAKSKHPIVGGSYPFRTMSPRLNLQSLECHGESWEINQFRAKYADQNGEVEVQKLPTGFLMIDCSVFRKLMQTAETYKHKDPTWDEPQEEKMFFPIGIHNGWSETEDWGFCRIAKEAGFKIYWNTEVVCDHMGIHRFSIRNYANFEQKPEGQNAR
jgi:hypothetical protein